MGSINFDSGALCIGCNNDYAFNIGFARFGLPYHLFSNLLLNWFDNKYTYKKWKYILKKEEKEKMKIIIRNNYSGSVKEFKNRAELLFLIENGGLIGDLGKMKGFKEATVNELLYYYYGDFRRVQ